MIIVRYEDLIEDTAQQLGRMLSVAGINVLRLNWKQPLARSSFSSMQKRERANRLDNPRWPKNKPFVRRGKVGSFRDEMPAEVQMAFLREAAPVMDQLGYISS